MPRQKTIRFVIDVPVPQDTSVTDLARKKIAQEIAMYAQGVALPQNEVKPGDSEYRGSVHTHAEGCGVCGSEAPYASAEQLTSR